MPQQSPSSNSGMTPGSGGPQPMSQFGGVPGSNTMPSPANAYNQFMSDHMAMVNSGNPVDPGLQAQFTANAQKAGMTGQTPASNQAFLTAMRGNYPIGTYGPPAPYQQPQQGAFNPFASYFAASNPFMAAINSLMQRQPQTYTQQSIADTAAQRQAASGAPATYQTPAAVQQALTQPSSPVTAQAPTATAAPSVASPVVPWYEGMNGEVGGGSGGAGGAGSP